MTVYRIPEDLVFPDPEEAEPDGLLGVGGDLSPSRLLLSYASGIFPWYGPDMPILWYSPDPRAVLLPSQLRVGRSLAKEIRRSSLRLSMDTAFDRVVRGCAAAPRPGQPGTWITQEMIDAYGKLHRLGYAHSVEAWDGEELAGGLYGVSLGRAFFGESMFAHLPNASKIAFVRLTGQLERWGFDLIDCQMRTDHLDRFGAEQWPRSRFLAELRRSLEAPTLRGRWSFDTSAGAGGGDRRDESPAPSASRDGRRGAGSDRTGDDDGGGEDDARAKEERKR